MRREPWVATSVPLTEVWDVTQWARESWGPYEGDATLGLWLVHAPWMSAGWDWHCAFVVHLRDGPGLPPAQKSDPSETHEFLSWAIDPDHAPDMAADRLAEVVFLQPAGVVQRFAASSDAAALERVTQAMELVGRVRIGLEPEFRTWWQGWLAGAR